jgi:hypothetical protein
MSGHGWATSTYKFIVKDYGLTPAKPTLDMEPPYGNRTTGKSPRIDSHQVRQGSYWNMLAGVAGHGYGALDLFYLYKDDDGPFPRNGFQPWRKALAYPSECGPRARLPSGARRRARRVTGTGPAEGCGGLQTTEAAGGSAGRGRDGRRLLFPSATVWPDSPTGA